MIQQRERMLDLADGVLGEVLDEHCPPNQHAEEWDLDALGSAIKERFGFVPQLKGRAIDRDGIAEFLWSEIEKILAARETEFSLPLLLYFGRFFFQEEIDQRWIEHLKNMEALREGIGLRGYGQKDPKQEYKKEGFVVFGHMMANINRNVSEKLYHVQVRREDEAQTQQQMAAQQRRPRKTIESGGGAAPTESGGGDGDGDGKTVRRAEPKVGRNDPCPCGSGRKYKKCHGAVAA
jgi:preprotein translocase subunit SecA